MNRILSCCVSRTYFSYIMLHYEFFTCGLFVQSMNILFSFSIKIKNVSVIDWKEIQSRSIFPQKWQSRLSYSIQNVLLITSWLIVWITFVYSHCKYLLSVAHGPINTLLIPSNTRHPSSRLIVFSRVHVQCWCSKFKIQLNY